MKTDQNLRSQIRKNNKKRRRKRKRRKEKTERTDRGDRRIRERGGVKSYNRHKFGEFNHAEQ